MTGVDRFTPTAAGRVTLAGDLGRSVGLTIDNWVLTQDVDAFTAPFADYRDGETGGFRGEFFGKWLLSLVDTCAIRPSPAATTMLHKAVADLLATQSPDGYIGTYLPAHRLDAFDIWNRKYTLWALVAYNRHSGNAAALDAACRLTDHLLDELSQHETTVADTGLSVLRGVGSSSLLHPVALLYQATGAARYLAFAEEIVASWSRPSAFAPQGLRLIEDALAGVAPADMASAKAYELMSCFEGLCELYRATGNTRHLRAAVAMAAGLREHELTVIGSGSYQELWCGSARIQTEVAAAPLETCVTTYWMRLCVQLLQLTGDASYADDLELTLFNALLGAVTPQGDWWSYFSPLAGYRVPSHSQFPDIAASCCVANGARGLLMTPQWAVMASQDGPVVNLYCALTATVDLSGGGHVTLEQQTCYPHDGDVTLVIHPSPRAARFVLRLRIPGWSKHTVATVNGQTFACEPGGYAEIDRVWQPGDRVSLRLDLTARTVSAPGHPNAQAILRGPIVLALDTRLADPGELIWLITDARGGVELTGRADTPPGVSMAFNVPFEVRPSHYFDWRRVSLGMSDFASASNGFSETGHRYRVWLPQPLLNTLAYAYEPGPQPKPFFEPSSSSRDEKHDG